MSLEDIVLAVVAATLFAVWLLFRALRRELESWEQSLKEIDPKDLP